MLEEEKVVPTESTTVNQDVNQEPAAVETPSAEELASATSAPETIAEQIKDQDVDEKGVSYKNRYEEMRRKNEQLIDSLPQIIEQTIQQNLSKNTQQQTPKTQEYSIEQIEQFVTENPQYKAWGEGEKAKIIARQAADELEKRQAVKEREREFISRRQQAEAVLKKEFPAIFTQDAYGRDVLDPTNPMTVEIAGIMKHPDLQRSPDGLLVAAEIAHSRLLRRGQINTVKKEAQLKKEVKKLEKKTFTEGGNKTQPVVKNELGEAIGELKKNSSKKNVGNAVAAYFRQAGYIQ